MRFSGWLDQNARGTRRETDQKEFRDRVRTIAIPLWERDCGNVQIDLAVDPHVLTACNPHETVITPEGKAETVETDTTITFGSSVPPAVEPAPGEPHSAVTEISVEYPSGGEPGQAIQVEDTEDRLKKAADAAKKMRPLHPRTDFPPLEIPVIRFVAEPPRFELAAITDEQAFRELGRKLAVDPDRFLARKALEGEIDDERRVAALSAHSTATQVEASESIESAEAARDQVRRSVLASSLVEGRKGAVAQIDRLLDLVLDGAGKQSETLLTSYARRLSDRLIEEIDTQRKKIMKTGGDLRRETLPLASSALNLVAPLALSRKRRRAKTSPSSRRTSARTELAERSGSKRARK